MITLPINLRKYVPAKLISAWSKYGDWVILAILLSFIFLPLSQVILPVNLSTPLFVLLGIFVLIGLAFKGISKPLLICIGLFGLFLAFGFGMGLYRHIAVKNIILSGTYYIKPILFLLLGYLFVTPKVFKKFMWITFFFMVISIPVFVLFGSQLIEISRVRLNDIGFFVPKSIFFSATKIDDYSALPRNPSFLFSYLDTSYVFLFITSMFIVSLKKKMHMVNGLTSLVLSFIGFITTFTRSTFIALPITIVSAVVLRIKNPKIVAGLLFVTTLITVAAIAIFWNKFLAIFVQQDSAAIHITNITDVFARMLKFPLGSGLGSSNWQGQASHPIYFYSEGSFFTTIVELGIQIVPWFGIVAYALFKRSRIVLLPIYLGFLVVSLLLPIGFSTQFLILFCVAFGILLNSKDYGEKSLYMPH